MSQVMQTNGDFVIKTRSPNNEEDFPSDIILDPAPGRIVKITGTLIVEGETISVAAEELKIVDNFIVINDGETGAGVTLQYAGLQVDRGTLPPANIIWEESSRAWTIAIGEEGNYNTNESAIITKSILTKPGVDNGNLTLIGEGAGVVSVAGTTDYELNVMNDDDIPNKKYVDTRIVAKPGHSISADDTFVYIADKDVPNSEPGSVQYYSDATSQFIESNSSAISLIVDDVLTGQIYSSKAVFKNLEIKNDEGFAAVLTNKNDGSNLYFKTTTGKLQTDYAIQLTQHASVPSFALNSTLIYADTPGNGTTGLYFVAAADTIAAQYRTDELVSKKRALLYSMIF